MATSLYGLSGGGSGGGSPLEKSQFFDVSSIPASLYSSSLVFGTSARSAAFSADFSSVTKLPSPPARVTPGRATLSASPFRSRTIPVYLTASCATASAGGAFTGTGAYATTFSCANGTGVLPAPPKNDLST